jgi:ACS family sodium-dependent inorganic phosphate cotransporter
MLHLLPLSLSAQCRCGGPPSRRRIVGGGSPSQRSGPGILGNGVRVRLRTRALGCGTDVQPDTPSSRRDGDERPHADAGQEDDGGGEALLESVRKLLLMEDTTPGEEEGQGQFPKRWAIVFLCFSAFLLCNMDRVRVCAPILLLTTDLHTP